jgi:tRNA dimethylallyltransferase
LQQRVEAMLAQGWLAEIEGLWRDFGPDLPLLNTLGYAEMARHLRGEWSREEAIAATVQRTRQLAKQQQTWFRHPENGGNAPWLDRETAVSQILENCQKNRRGNV